MDSLKADIKSIQWVDATEQAKPPKRSWAENDKTIKASIKRLLNGKKSLFEIEFYDSPSNRKRINDRIWADVVRRKRDAELAKANKGRVRKSA